MRSTRRDIEAVVFCNRPSRPAAGLCHQYNIHPHSSSTTTFSDNVGGNCDRYSVAPHVVELGNHLE